MTACLLGDGPVRLVNCRGARAWGVLQGLRRLGWRSGKNFTVAWAGRGSWSLGPLLPLSISEGLWVAHIGVPHWRPAGVPGPGGPRLVGRQAAGTREGGGLLRGAARRALLTGSLLWEDLRGA